MPILDFVWNSRLTNAFSNPCSYCLDRLGKLWSRRKRITQIITMIPWLIGFIGQVGGGFLSDYLYLKIGNMLLARKLVIVPCLIASAASVALCGMTRSAYMAVILISLGVFFMYATISNYWAIIQDTVRSENVGGVGGFVHFLSNIAGIVGPSATGFLVQASGSFRSAFLLVAGLGLAGALAIAFFARPTAVGTSAAPVAAG